MTIEKEEIKEEEIKEEENKKEIVKNLFLALRGTRNFNDLAALKYVVEEHENKETKEKYKEEFVEVYFSAYSNTPSKRISVSLDSGWALIKDVVKNIG